MSLDCALAKSGYGEMGIAGTIAGPLFNLMIGFGLSSLQILIKNKGNPVEINFNQNQKTLLLGVSYIIVFYLICVLIQSICLKFKLNSKIAYLGFIFYLGYFLFICLQTFVYWKY